MTTDLDIPHIMLVSTRQHEKITSALREGAIAELDNSGASFEQLVAPSLFCIPAAIQFAIRSLDFDTERRRFDGYVALGCFIKSKQPHQQPLFISGLQGIQDMTQRYTLAIGLGLMSTKTPCKALEWARIDGGDVGGRAVRDCLDMIDMKRMLNLFPR